MARLRTDSIPQQFAALKQEYYGGVSPARSDYAISKPSRFRRNRTGLYGSGDSHYAAEQPFLRFREISRDMYRNDAVIGQAVRRIAGIETQTGSMFAPDTGDTGIDEELRQRMRAWSCDPDQCDITGRYSLPMMEFQIALAEYVDGDVVALPLETGHLQLMEAHLLRTPTNTKLNVVHGVQIDRNRKPQRYFFAPDNINPWERFEKVGDAIPVDAYDAEGFKQVFHVFEPHRPTQTRGVFILVAAVDQAGMWEDSTFATLVKVQMAACLMGSWETNDQYGAGVDLGSRDTQTRPDGGQDVIEQMAPGLIARPPKGMKLNIHSPNIPASETMEFSRRILQVLSVNLDMPLAVFLLDGAENNFAGIRYSMDLAKIGIRRRQLRRKTQFNVEVGKWKIRQWLAEDSAMRTAAAKQGVDVFKHRWESPGLPYPQPVHDVTADAMKLTNLITSPTMLHSEDGRAYNDVAGESVRDNGFAIQKAIKEADRINIEAGKDIVSWRDVLNRDMPKGDQLIDTAETTNTNDGTTTTVKK